MFRFGDTFEMFAVTSGDPRTKWTQGFSNFGQIAANGRNGKCFQLFANGSISKTLDYQNTWIIEWATKTVSGNGSFGGASYILRANNVNLATLNVLGDATLQVYAGSSLSSSCFNTSFSLHPLTWYFFQLKIELSGSTDISVTATLKIDGTERGSGSHLSGINVNTLINQFAEGNNHIFSDWAGQGVYLDDLRIMDGQGPSPFDDFLGDLKGLMIVPNGDVQTEWTPFGPGTDHFERVNEQVSDDDITYVKSNTIDQKENYDWEDVPASVGEIKGYQYSLFARKDNEGSRAIRQTEGDDASSGDQEGPDIVLNDNYIYYTWTINNVLDTATFNARRHGWRVIEVPES